MDKETFERAANIFVDAANIDPSARERFISDACGDDEALLNEVRSLLRASEGADEYFADLADRLGIAADSRPTRPVIGEAGLVIGAYTLTEPVGSGGSGTVWRATRTDGQYEGEVAIKLVNPAIATGVAATRIAQEAQHLSRLSHPNIARLLDAGVDNADRRYLVLEYVDGTRIDSYCSENSLSVFERIRLFQEVLRAVAHAHARLIVHRDIKPSNVLVDRRGKVKLLDFGIATLLHTRADGNEPGATLELGTALTPEYAAPEQLFGQSVTTETDVYALGLMLFELLAGRNPRGDRTLSSYAELVELATQDPPKASIAAAQDDRDRSLQRKLRGDLDSILQKALSPDPDRRYVTATEFAADLQRYLNGEAVSAVPPTVGYRARKFIGRHRGGVAGTLLTAIALVAALSVATLQMFEARKQRDAALYQQQRVHASNEFYSLLLEDMGSEENSFTAVELLDRGAEMLDRQFDPSQPFIGRIHYDLSRRYANMRERKRELELLALAEQSARQNDDDDLLAATLCTTAWARRFEDPAMSRKIAEEGSVALRRVAQPSIDGRIACLRVDAQFAEADGSREQAIEILLEARGILDSTAAAPAHLRGIVRNDLSGMYFKSAKFNEALAINQETLDLLENSGRGDSLVYMQVLSNRGVFLGATGEILADYTTRKQLVEKLENSRRKDGRASIPYKLGYGNVLLRMSRFDEGLEVLESVYEDISQQGLGVELAMSKLYLAGGYIAVDRFAEAERFLDEIEPMFLQNANALAFQLATVEISRAKIARKQGRYQEARRRLEPLLESYGYPPLTTRSSRVAAVLIALALVEIDAENFARAETLVSDLLVIREAVARKADSSAMVGKALYLRAQARYGLGNVEGATADLERAIPSLVNGLGGDNIEVSRARTLLDDYRQAAAAR